MVIFNLWTEAFIFSLVYSIIIIIPCIIIAVIGKKLIDQLGQNPSNAPLIQMGIVAKLIAVEVVTFFFLISFYFVFSR